MAYTHTCTHHYYHKTTNTITTTATTATKVLIPSARLASLASTSLIKRSTLSHRHIKFSVEVSIGKLPRIWMRLCARFILHQDSNSLLHPVHLAYKLLTIHTECYNCTNVDVEVLVGDFVSSNQVMFVGGVPIQVVDSRLKGGSVVRFYSARLLSLSNTAISALS